MAKALVFDATPLIYMIKVSLAEALTRLGNPKFLPQGVYDELLKGERLGKPEASLIRELVEGAAFTLARPSDASLVRRLIRLVAEDEKKPLHGAEAEALVLAKELNGVVISDDHVARSTARLIDAELHGTGYLLGRIYQAGQITREQAMAKLSEMRRVGWRLSEDDYRGILEYLEML